MENMKVRNQKGENGGIVATTGTHLGQFDAIYAHTAAVVDVVSAKLTGTTTALEVPAGSTYFGLFSSVTVVSGKVTIYNAV